MPSTINADNGVVSGSAGLKYAADNSGVLQLQTNGTTAASISTAQVVNFTNPITVAGATPAYLPVMSIVTGTTQAAVAGTHYVLTNVAATTVTFPVAPTAADVIWISVDNGLATNVVNPNGQKIRSTSGNMTLDVPYAEVQFRYVNSTIGWTFT